MDLTFSLGERWTEDGEPAGIGGTVEFRTDVYDAGTRRGLVERLQQVLTCHDRRSRRALSSVELLDDPNGRGWTRSATAWC